MDEPYWLLWIAGPFFVIVGIIGLIDHERWYARLQRYKSREPDPTTRAVMADTYGDSRAIWIPSLFFPPIGLYLTFFGLSRFFEWGYV